MMSLSEQVLSFLFAFLYGYISFLLYRLSYKHLYSLNKIYSFFNTFLFTIILTLIYFKIYTIINDGVINLYFILITFSYLLSMPYNQPPEALHPSSVPALSGPDCTFSAYQAARHQKLQGSWQPKDLHWLLH